MLLEKAYSLILLNPQWLLTVIKNQVNTNSGGGGPPAEQDQRNSLLSLWMTWALSSSITLGKLGECFLATSQWHHQRWHLLIEELVWHKVLLVAWSFLSGPGWPQTCSDPFASASQRGLQRSVVTTRVCFIFVWGYGLTWCSPGWPWIHHPLECWDYRFKLLQLPQVS